jgi:hypothetical protein
MLEGLTLWVKAVTFVCAQLAGEDARPCLHGYLYNGRSPGTIVGAVKAPVEAIDKAYKEHGWGIKKAGEEHWHQDFSIAPRMLEEVLNRFPNLNSVRVDVADEPDFLGGWLTPTQAQYLKTRYRAYIDEGPLRPSSFYKSDRHHVPRMILRALSSTGTSVKDLRFTAHPAFGDYWSDNPLIFLVPWLRTLRIAVMPNDVMDWQRTGLDHYEQPPLIQALEKMRALEDLAITLDLQKAVVPRDQYDTYLETMAHNVFNAVPSKLRRFALEGNWTLSEANLISFITQHAITLQCLINYGSTLNGNWMSAISTIPKSTESHLQYISVQYVEMASVGTKVSHCSFRRSDVETLGSECVTDLESHPKDYSNVVNGEEEDLGDSSGADDSDGDDDGEDAEDAEDEDDDLEMWIDFEEELERRMFEKTKKRERAGKSFG